MVEGVSSRLPRAMARRIAETLGEFWRPLVRVEAIHWRLFSAEDARILRGPDGEGSGLISCGEKTTRSATTLRRLRVLAMENCPGLRGRVRARRDPESSKRRPMAN